jgi:hypothetical protein
MAADELFAILFTGKPVPYSEYYLIKQRAAQYSRDQDDDQKTVT